MRNHNHDKADELLEILWYINEKGDPTVEAARKRYGEEGYQEAIDALTKEGAVTITGDAINFAGDGEKRARGIVRRHRLAERLLTDALGMRVEDTELGACEFEHVVTPEISDSICTLLGHPRVCPHGMLIPEGDCCREAKKSVVSGVVPLTGLIDGQEAKVVYVNARSESRMKKLLLMGVTPGVMVKLCQTNPAVVIEIGDSQIAMEQAIADDIFVWRENV